MARTLFVLCFSWLLSGCGGTSFVVRVDSIATPDQAMGSFVVKPGKKDLIGGDLLFREFALYVKRALVKNGYTEAQSEDRADIAVLMTYGVAGGTVGTYTTMHTDHFGNIFGASTDDVTAYSRIVIIKAFDLKKYLSTKEEVLLWQTTIESTGSSDDLRRVFPVLIAAVQPHIGTNTGRKITIGLEEDDDRVLFIKGTAISSSSNR